MERMSNTNDGFKISEQDLLLRGPGEFFGTKQHGLPELKLANLYEDIPLLKEVQEICKDIFDNKINISKQEKEILLKKVENEIERKISIWGNNENNSRYKKRLKIKWFYW